MPCPRPAGIASDDPGSTVRGRSVSIDGNVVRGKIRGMTCTDYHEGEVNTMTELTPGQLRTAKATATKMRNADEKLAAKLRDRGWTCIPPAPAPAPAALVSASR